MKMPELVQYLPWDQDLVCNDICVMLPNGLAIGKLIWPDAGGLIFEMGNGVTMRIPLHAIININANVIYINLEDTPDGNT